MLNLSGRAVALRHETYPATRNGQTVQVNRFTLGVATLNGVCDVQLPEAILTPLASHIGPGVDCFGKQVAIICHPRLGYEYGKPFPTVEADAVRVVDGDTGEIVAEAPAPAAPAVPAANGAHLSSV